jgi:hypothetical protein
MAFRVASLLTIEVDLDSEMESFKSSFTQGPKANDSKVLTMVPE